MNSLTRFTRETGGPQLFAWHRSIGALKEQLRGCLPEGEGIGVVLEFELPRTGGRRPDLIILENGTVVLVEFKNRVEVEPADIDQVRRYVMDLEDYHLGCRERRLVPVLVPLGMVGAPYETQGIHVMPPSNLGTLVKSLSTSRRRHRADVAGWTAAPYEPMPGLVEAARLLFERQPLARIRTAESARIPEVVALLESIVCDAVNRSARTLVLVAGVPGSGKTLVGLQLVHSRNLPVPAVFLSGNGPLVQVLQYALGAGRARREFIQPLRSYLKDALVRTSAPSRERVLAFDEAQRAWDKDRVLERYRGELVGSQPELLVRIADRSPEKPFVLVAFMGEGQEIHAGEEAGIGQWVEAVAASSGWEVSAPPHLSTVFADAGIPVRSEGVLNLTTSLRSQRASRTADWANELLRGNIQSAAQIAETMSEDGFDLHASRVLEPLREYARARYAADPARRYGMIVSSKFRGVVQHGVRPVQNDFWYYGQWYEEDQTHARSCCQLDSAVTEFGCQGLELDLPILCWGPDLVWDGKGWRAHTGRRNNQIVDPVRLRFNAYRVLLTRGRDGLCIFVPREPSPQMDSSYQALVAAGVKPLP